MNDYEAKRAARIERMHARAERLRRVGEARFEREHARLSMIPLGQPILIGHHSERRHRRELEKAERDRRAGMAALDEAKTLERRAHAAETNPAISSDDPDAIDKLREKAASLETDCERMKRANAMIRKGATAEQLAAMLGWTVELARKLLEKDFAGRIGFPPYKLTNTRSEIRRINERIATLERQRSTPAPEPIIVGEVRIEEADNRVRIVFPGKPDEATRSKLKSRGFRWSPMAGAWQRHASPGAWYDAKDVLGALQRTAP
jgi:uncharacterized protein DUF3560